jgi:xanthine dehydrogenase YagS FAD-binding subunit
MIKFTHINAESVQDAQAKLAQYGDKAKLLAGGTDLVGLMQHQSLPTYPEYIINLKTIPDMDYIREDAGTLKMGALAKLHDIAFSSTVTAKWSALAQAARGVASWQVRNMGTIGGNICQQTRCWYYRCAENKFFCLRKGGQVCYALIGNNREHSIFGAASGCVASHPSDTATALLALDAKVVTNKRTVNIADFFDGFKDTVLAADEFVTEVQVPAPPSGNKQAFAKASLRRAVDFALVNAACVITPSSGNVTSAAIAINAVGTKPIRATAAEQALVGKTLAAGAEAAATAAVSGTTALAYNKYKIELTKGMVRRVLTA